MYTHAQKPGLTDGLNGLKKWIGLMLAALVVAGCSSTGTQNETSPEPETVEPPATVEPAPVEEVIPEPSDFAADGVTPIDANGRPISRTFYFEYDKSVLNPSDLAALELHAQILRRNSDRSIVIEGHCDERGTREYNLALGERRASTVEAFLLSAGVSSRQIETVSYGEEQPEDPGHDEGAWERNRRAVVSYR